MSFIKEFSVNQGIFSHRVHHRLTGSERLSYFHVQDSLKTGLSFKTRRRENRTGTGRIRARPVEAQTNPTLFS
jgi:hypothetical protein